MERIGKRINITGTEIHISSPKRTGAFLRCIAAIGIYLCIAVMTATSGLTTPSGLTAFIWYGAMAIAGAWFAFCLTWLVVGREVIQLRDRALVIKRSIFGKGPSRSFAISGIIDLRASNFGVSSMSLSYSFARMGLVGGSIAFEYNGKTQRFGIDLEESDAKALLVAIRARFDIASTVHS